MSKSLIDDHLWAEVRKARAVDSGSVTLKYLTEGLLDRSNELRDAGRKHLAHADASLEDTSANTEPVKTSVDETVRRSDQVLTKGRPSNREARVLNVRKSKPRFGLPEGFRPRLQQYRRSVLLEDNIYSLPGGQEFIPKYPTGTLGRPCHLYALLTAEQFETGRRGSVYVRTDGRIFDYSVDHADPLRDMFDTGYTIHDLERTGRYAANDESKKRKNEDVKPRRLAHAG